MTAADTSAPPVLAALERETDALLARVLEIFLEFDFLDHRLLELTSGGEVVTHLSREADRMADALAGATGQHLPPVDPERDWSLEQGGGLRPGAVLVHDLHESAARLTRALAGVDDWMPLEPGLRDIPARRLLQVVVHSVDLDRPWDSVPLEDAAVAAAQLPHVLAPELAGIPLPATDDPRVLLGWATGRIAGLDLPPGIPVPASRPLI